MGASCSKRPAVKRGHKGYQTRNPQESDLYRLLIDHLETFFAHYDQRFRPHHGRLRPEVQRTLDELIHCGVYRFGLIRVKCRVCGHETLVPLSCRKRGVCQSCHQKRRLVWTEWMREKVLPDVPYRQWVLSLPKALRVFFRFDSELFKGLSRIVVDAQRGLGVAWRPITDKAYPDVGTPEMPPQTPAAAEVRWLTVEPEGKPSAPHRHATTAQPLASTTGVGPWPLAGNGLKAGRLAGRAVFVRIDDRGIMGARSPDAIPAFLAPIERLPLLTFREHASGLQMFLLDSSPRIRAMSLRCE